VNDFETAYGDFMKVVQRHADHEKELEAEVERLREVVRVGFAAQERADYEAIEMLKAEVERLRAESESYRALAARRGAEVERLRAERDNLAALNEANKIDAREQAAEVERLRAALEQIAIQPASSPDMAWAAEVAENALAEEVTPIHTDP
jgi:hypothetical protein